MLLVFLLISTLVLISSLVVADLVAARAARAVSTLRVSGDILRALPPGRKPDPEIGAAVLEYTKRVLSSAWR